MDFQVYLSSLLDKLGKNVLTHFQNYPKFFFECLDFVSV